MKVNVRKKAEPVLAVCLLFVMIFMVAAQAEKYTGKASETEKYLRESWYYIEDGKRVEAELPMTLKRESKEPFVLYNDGLTREAACRTVSTKGAFYKMTAALDGELLYAYKDDAFPRNTQMAKKLDCDWVLPLETEGKTLALTYQDVDNGSFKIDDVTIGTSGYVMGRHLAESGFQFVNVFFMMILSVASMFVALCLKHIQMLDFRLVDVAVFLVICGVWSTTDSSLVQLLTGLNPVTNYISFFAFMLIPVPMLRFIRRTGEMARFKVLDGMVYACCINVIVQSALNYFFGIPMIAMLFITHTLLFASVVLGIILLVREYKEKKQEEIHVILKALTVLGTVGLISIALYWALEITYYDAIFELGILIFICILLFQIISSMVTNMRYKAEMLVYRRLAKEDWLTGLLNRLAFDEYMEEIEKKAENGRKSGNERLAMVFMDINGLKEVNDRYGHEAGDELIRAAADIIRDIFGTGGRCFRMGGDEFSVILEASGEKISELLAAFDNGIGVYNRDSRYFLEIARGVSYLRRADGSSHSVSCWMQEADQRMYEDKERRHIEAKRSGRE